MEKILFMFPGQGSQVPGMGKDLFEKEPVVRELFAAASEILGRDMAKLCFESPEDELRKTENAQPALFLCAYSVCSVLRQKGREPQYVAGHSLGEYAAAAAAGMLPFKSGIRLVQRRGTLMAQAGQKKPGTMAAIIGMKRTDVENLCKEAFSSGLVVVANHNSPEQLVISGEIHAVEKAMELAKIKGAKRAIALSVSGAFHSPLMEETVTDFKQALLEVQFQDAHIPVLSNVTARPVTSGSEMQDLLLRQLVSPVQWVSCMEKAFELGVETAVEAGPGKVLTGLARRINGSIKLFNIEDKAGIDAFLQATMG